VLVVFWTAPSSAGVVQNGPDKVEAAGLAGQPADDLDPAAGLTEGALDEFGVPDPLVVLEREPQAAGELLPVGEQAHDCRGVQLAVGLGERVDAGSHGRAVAKSCYDSTTFRIALVTPAGWLW
jgi:hypothetical protein